MTAHVVFTAIDARDPATTSRKVMREVVRGEIGYDGLVMSDDLSMKALKGDFAPPGRARRYGPDATSSCIATAIWRRCSRSRRPRPS